MFLKTEADHNRKRKWTRRGKEKNHHVTKSCRGNAFETDALDQSDAQSIRGTANQRVAGEDLNKDAEP